MKRRPPPPPTAADLPPEIANGCVVEDWLDRAELAEATEPGLGREEAARRRETAHIRATRRHRRALLDWCDAAGLEPWDLPHRPPSRWRNEP